MQPILFTIPGTGIPVHSWGATVAFSLIVGWALSLHWARRDRLPAQQLGTAYVLAVAGALFGSRLLWTQQHVGEPGAESLFSVEAGGMAVGGGLILASIVTFLYTRTRRIPFFAWTDCMAPGTLFGVAMERFGAFLAGADFGITVDADFALGVRYPPGSPAYAYHADFLNQLSRSTAESLPVHPATLYAMVVALLGVVVALFVRKRRRFAGQVTFVALSTFIVGQMIVEDAFRIDGSESFIGFLTYGMVSGGGLLAILGIAYRSLAKSATKHPERHQPWRGGRDKA